jgi:integrase/recombinase XerD
MKRRVSLPFEEWPAEEQSRWRAIFQKARLGEEDGAGSHLRPTTRTLLQSHWGRWLLWLRDRGELTCAPAYTLLTKERLSSFWASLSTLAPNTQAMIFEALDQCANWMAPGEDRPWIKTIRIAIRREQYRRRDKRPRLVEAGRLAELGWALMEQAREKAHDLPVRHLTRFRDGLLIAMLTATALRLANLTGIRLDDHLRRKGDEYWLCFRAKEMKNNKSLKMPLPTWLNAPLEEYLSVIRPALLAGRHEDALWITKDGQPMPYWSIEKQINVQTRRAFGHTVNPHLFRDCVATSIAMAAPARIRTAQDVLGHSSFKTTEEHYIHADQQKSVRAYHALLQKRARNRRLHKDPP